jgi:hypothetical protein
VTGPGCKFGLSCDRSGVKFGLSCDRSSGDKRVESCLSPASGVSVSSSFCCRVHFLQFSIAAPTVSSTPDQTIPRIQ